MIKISCTGAGLLEIDQMKEFQGNLKSLSKQNYKRLRDEILNTGFAFPFHIWIGQDDQYYLIGGHQRKRALEGMRKEGIEIPPLPIVYVEAENYKEAKRRVVQDVSQYGKVDKQGLYEFVVDAGFEIENFTESFDIPQISFDMEAFKEEFFEDKSGAGGGEDDVPENVESITQVGDRWQLGEHLLMCGDSTSLEQVTSLLNGEIPDMVYTDPPYGIDIVQSKSVDGSKPFGSVGGGKLCKVNQYAPIIGDSTTLTAVNAYKLCVELNIQTLIFWGGNHYSSALPDSSCWIVWDKQNTGNFADAELAWTNQKTAVRIFKHMWNGMIKASEHGTKRVHPTQKPIALAEWCFEQYSTVKRPGLS